MGRLTSALVGCCTVAGIFAAVLSTAEAADSQLVASLKQRAQEMKPFSVRVIGFPTATSEWGFIQKPFWNEAVKELGAGKVTVQLNSMSELNLQGAEVFRLTSQGTFDIADTVANYGAGELPQLDGLDLAGVAPSFELERKVLQAYRPVVEQALKDRFGLVLLGVAHSTAQMFFCKPEVKSVADLRGKKVRLTSSTLADVVSGLGATPVTMPFAEAIPAMQRGVVDCMITGTMSANTAKVYEVGDYAFPLVVGWAPHVRMVNRRFWDRLDDAQRQWLQDASTYYFREMSDPIEERNTNEGLWCSTGDSRCTLDGQFGVKKATMKTAQPSEADLKTLRDVVQSKVLPAFARGCGAPCAESWSQTAGQVTGLKAAP